MNTAQQKPLAQPSNRTSNGVALPEKNFLSWHYSIALDEFIKKRLGQLAQTPKFFSVASLIRNLFAPYRRMAAIGKEEKFGATGLFDRLTFNLTSCFVGAGVRVALIFAWILATIFLFIFDFLAILIFLIFPLVSLPLYIEYRNNHFFDKDLADSSVFLNKLSKTQFFKLLSQFFEDDLLKLFQKFPQPTALGLTSSQKLHEVFLTFPQSWPDFKKYLEGKNIKTKEFEILANYLANHLGTPQKTQVAPIGQMLSFGYTNTLDQFATELTSMRLPSPSKKEVLMGIEKILARPQNNNVLLVGEPGVGRHNTLYELASAIERGQLLTLSGRRVMLLDSISLASVGKNLVETKKAFEAVFEEAKGAGNIIMSIDHIDKLSSTKSGRIDITDVLTAVLTDNSLPIIGITTPDDFNQFVRPNSNFSSLFERIDIQEATIEETVNILVGKTLEVYPKENINILLTAILEIAAKSDRLVMDRKQPEKSILLLEDAIAEAKSRGLKTIDLNLVDEVISRQTKTPVGKIGQTEAQKLKNLESLLHQRIIGQNEAITSLARAMRRARAEIEAGARPIGSFLFLGPTGVGKTETAKALAEAYFGQEERMQRLDMSEFSSQDALERLIGNADKGSPGQLATMIRENPYTLLLVDEFEKATRDVHNLFLQILDEGFMTDAFGKKVSFDNVIIIATSNAGAEFIREELASQGEALQGSDLHLSQKLIEHVLKKGLFNPELINRFDGVVVYHPLFAEQVTQVTILMLKRLAKQLKESKNITLEITTPLAQKVAQLGFDPTFGARPIRRLIADKIEDGIAKMIIEGTAKNGDTISAATLLNFVS